MQCTCALLQCYAEISEINRKFRAISGKRLSTLGFAYRLAVLCPQRPTIKLPTVWEGFMQKPKNCRLTLLGWIILKSLMFVSTMFLSCFEKITLRVVSSTTRVDFVVRWSSIWARQLVATGVVKLRYLWLQSNARARKQKTFRDVGVCSLRMIILRLMHNVSWHRSWILKSYSWSTLYCRIPVCFNDQLGNNRYSWETCILDSN